MPSIGSEYFDSGIVHTADCIILVLSNLNEMEKITPFLSRSTGKKIIAINKSDILSEEDKRKLTEKIKSKKLNALLVSSLTGEGIKELKSKIASSMNLIRVYTKEPGKQPAKDPMILRMNATVKEAAESILKGFSARIKEARVTGPSSKFPNQKVGLAHPLKDRDIVEFHTK